MQNRTYSKAITSFICMGAVTQLGFSRRFYSDDPMWREPPPRSVQAVQPSNLDNLIDFYKNSFHDKGERNSARTVHPSQGVNTVGEVPGNAWYRTQPDRSSRPRRPLGSDIRQSGAGLRFRAPTTGGVVMRMDAALSHEGFQLSLGFNDIFATRLRTDGEISPPPGSLP